MRAILLTLALATPATAYSPFQVADAVNWGYIRVNGSLSKEQFEIDKALCSKSGIIVAVIDTGIDPNHASIKKSLIGAKSFDYVTRSQASRDNHGHGTHIAGIIAGDDTVGIKNTPFRGICPGVKVISLRYYDEAQPQIDNMNNSNAAIDYAVRVGAKIINFSGGGGQFSQDEYNAIKRAEAKGVLVVAAAGNERSNTDMAPYFPGSYRTRNVISVASIGSNSKISIFSNFSGRLVDIAAPGENIISGKPWGGYMSMSGTSQATAFVSGAAALLLSKNPRLTPAQLISILKGTVSKVYTLKGLVQSGGVLDVRSAVRALPLRHK